MAEATTAAVGDDQIALFKDYLAENRFRIKLDDLVNVTVQGALHELGGERFPLQTGRISGDEFARRMKGYEEVIRPLFSQAVLLGKWATP